MALLRSGRWFFLFLSAKICVNLRPG